MFKRLNPTYICLILFLFFKSFGFSQLDTKHYIPPLFGRTNVQNHYVVISTPSAAPVNVTIKQGNGALITTTTITDVSPATILLGTGYTAPGIVNTSELNTINAVDGLIVEGSDPIYVNLRHVQGAQGLSLTSKGKATGLGTRFRSGHIYSSTAKEHVKAHEISVMATENGTTVTFSDISPNVIFKNTPVTGTTSNNITITLNAGESYVIAAFMDEPGATGNLNDVNGTLVSSNKPIACNTGSWLSGAHNNGRDIGVDQIVPIEFIGTEYIFVEGDGNANTERPLVVAEYDNTAIYLNGNATAVATINAGDYYYLPQTAYSANDNIYVQTTEPVFMYQSMSGTNKAATCLNFIPPLRCNGFKKVVIPSVNLVGVANVSITARANADVFVNGSATALTGGLTVPGNSCWLTYRIPGGAGDFVVESDSIINVALLTLQGVRGSAGYFTGFAQFTELDRGDTTAFVVCGEEASTYITYNIEGPYLSVTADFYDPSLGGSFTVDEMVDDTLRFTYERETGVVTPDTLELTVCKLLDCCGAIPDTICEVSTLVFTNAVVVETGLGDSITACMDTTNIELTDLLLGVPDPNGYWVDTDESGVLFGNTIQINSIDPGTYHYTYYVQGEASCFDSTVATINILPMSSSECCAIDPDFSITEPSCFGNTNGAILITDIYASEFSIDGGTNTQTNGNFLNLGSSTFNINLSDGPQCEYDTIINLDQPEVLLGDFVVDSVNCNTECNGQLTVNSAGGTLPYNYILGGIMSQTSNVFSDLCAGNKIVTVIDSNSCQVVIDTMIFEPLELQLTEVNKIDETCGNGNGSFEGLGIGGTQPYSYSLNGNPIQNTGFFANLVANNYTLEVTDANGCSAQINFEILNETGPTLTVDILQNVTCAGGLSGTVVIHGSGGATPFEYVLDGTVTQNSNYFTNIMAGNHMVVATDDNGCVADINFEIVEPSPLTITTVVTDVNCFEVCDGQIEVTASGSVPPYQYSSDNGVTFQISNILTGLCNGFTNLVVKDAEECLTNANVEIEEPTQLQSTQSQIDPECYQTATGEILFIASEGTGPYAYSIDGGSNFNALPQIQNLQAGIYDVVIQDNNGCQIMDQITLVDPPAFNFNFLQNNPSNCNSDDGSFQITASGGQAPYIYSIDGGATTQLSNGTFNNLFSGLYNLQVEDANGCVDSTYSALSDNVMTTNSVKDSVSCFNGNDGEVTVSQNFGSEPFTFTLNTTGSVQADGNFTGLEAGTYYVTVEDNGLCIAIEQFEILEPDSINFDLSVTNILCPDGTEGVLNITNLAGGNGSDYLYSIDGGANYGSEIVYTDLPSDTYFVFVKDIKNCLGSNEIEIIEPEPFTLAINHQNLECFEDNSGFVQLFAGGSNGPYTYNLNSTNTTGVFFGLAASNYPILITDDNGCQFDSVVNVTQPDDLVSVINTTSTSCFGEANGSAEAIVTGGTPILLYSADNGTTFQSSNLFNDLSVGCYEFYVLDDNSCSNVVDSCVVEPAEMNLILNLLNASCALNNGEVEILVSNGFPALKYSIDGGQNFGNSNLFTGLNSGEYHIVVEDDNGCQIDSTVTILDTPLPSIENVDLSMPLCFGGTNGELEVTSTGGLQPYEYSITSAIGPFQNSNNFTGISAGFHKVYVKELNGCMDSVVVELTQPTDIQITSTKVDLTCFENSTGEINMLATGGTNPHLYSIDNGINFQASGSFINLNQGQYNLVVKDYNNCLGNDVISVDEPTPLNFNGFTITQPNCFGDCDGSINPNVTGGTVTGSYSYLWSNNLGGLTTNIATNVCAGTYSLVVSDDNDCLLDTLNFVVGQPELALVDSANVTGVTCFGDDDGIIEIYSANAGSYSIGNGFSNVTLYESPLSLPSGLYMTSVLDTNGCVGDSLEVFIPTPQPLNGFVTPDVYICQADSVFFSVVATGGTTPHIFDVNEGASTAALIIEQIYADTTYYVNITDANGCTFDTDTMQVIVAPPPVLVANLIGNDTTVCEGESLVLTIEAADLLEDYEYLWGTGETNPTIYPMVSSDSTFYITVTDECGLTTDDSIVVTIFDDPVVNIVPNVLGGCPPFQVSYTLNYLPGEFSTDLNWGIDNGVIDSLNYSNLYVTYSDAGESIIDLNFVSVNGCPADTSYANTVSVFPLPEANFEYSPIEPTVYDQSISFLNTSSNFVNHVWWVDGDTLYDNSPNVYVNTLPIDTIFTACINVSNQFGCSDTLCKNVLIKNDFTLFVPNCIILDGKDQNSVFKPIGNNIHPDNYRLLVFNRWGEQIFETDDLSEGWNGTYLGKQVQDGVYVWRIDCTPQNDVTDKRTFTGHVSVMR